TVLGRAALLLPVFKLYGSCRDVSETARVALARSEQLIRLQEWRQLLSPVRDYVRDGGCLFLGVEGEIERVRELFSAIYAGPPPHPGNLFFLEDDPCATDAVILRLARGKSHVHRVKGT